MDSDLHSLNGVTSAHSDSGYASTVSHGSTPRATAAASTAAPSLNARLDRLTRTMGSLADRLPADAGASIGITRKTITRDPSRASEGRAVVGRVRREHRDDPQEDQPAQPPLKRRRTLPPRSVASQSFRLGSYEGENAREDDEEAPVRLTQVRSPRSGQLRTVACAAIEPVTSVDTCDGPMQLPSFMRDGPHNAYPPVSYSPPPDWLLHRLSAPSRAYDREPAPPPPFSATAPPDPLSDASSCTLAPFDFDELFEPLSTAHAPLICAPPPTAQHSPLPFSTSGRRAPPAYPARHSPAHSHAPLYEAQMARDPQLFHPPSPSPRFRPPVAAAPFATPHALAPHLRSPAHARPATPDTVFGQRVSQCGLLPSPHTVHASPGFSFLASSSPRIASDALFQPASYDGAAEPLSPASTAADFWKRRPQDVPAPPEAATPQQHDGRARYAALLKRSAAAALQSTHPIPPAASTASILAHLPEEHVLGSNEQNRPPAPSFLAQQERPPALEPEPAYTPAARTSSVEASFSPLSGLSPLLSRASSHALGPEPAGEQHETPRAAPVPAPATAAPLVLARRTSAHRSARASPTPSPVNTIDAVDAGGGVRAWDALGAGRALAEVVSAAAAEEAGEAEQAEEGKGDEGFAIWEDEDEIEEV
ncbi:hypothetical protein JCM10450v2_004796 [Rhodotorula kratochvilovae]